MSVGVVDTQNQFQYIKLPDGSYGKFRADLPDDQIKAAIKKDFPDAYPEEPTDLSQPEQGQGLLRGIGKGALNTVTGVSKAIHAIPKVGPALIPDQGLKAAEITAEPRTTPEKLGYYGEQAGEFLVPGAGEEEAGVLVGKALPKLGKVGPALGRTAAGILDTAAINKLQGGSAKEGAEAGAIGGALGEAGRAAAPAIAESALGITKRMRGYGKTPGEAVLNEVSGVRPATILRNATGKTNQLTGEIERMAATHPGTIDLRPALSIIDADIQKAAARNNAKAVAQLQDVRNSLSRNAITGLPLAKDQPAVSALNLKRGVRDQFVKNWNPELQGDVIGAAKKSSRAIDTELDRNIGPGFASKNQRVSSLIPVAERAESLERGAPIAQRAIHRVAAHTGALAGAVGGGYYGYEHRGLPGMVGGALGGILIPEIIASPEAGMVAARALHSGVPANAGKAIILQATRPSKDTERDDENNQ